MRLQAKGYIDDTDNLKGIIIGSSMLENTSVSDTQKKLQKSGYGTFLNLSLKGSAFSERKLVLDYALSNKKVSYVVYSLDPGPIFSSPLTGMQWEKLYDRNPVNDYLVYMNPSHLKCLFTFSASEKCVGKKQNSDYPPEWITDPLYKESFNGLCSWPIQSREILKGFLYGYNSSDLIKKYDFSYQKKYTEDNIFYLTDKYPNTSFYFLIPPYSALYYSIMLKDAKEELEYQHRYLEYFAKECDRRANCSLYGFNDLAFTADIRNYKDANHYSDKINDLMIDAVSKSLNKITVANIGSYFLRSKEIYKHIDLKKVKEELDACSLERVTP
ncbi:MAG: hypothetical protein ACI4NE_04995 [Succinivibrio sp.]